MEAEDAEASRLPINSEVEILLAHVRGTPESAFRGLFFLAGKPRTRLHAIMVTTPADRDAHDYASTNPSITACPIHIQTALQRWMLPARRSSNWCARQLNFSKGSLLTATF